MPDQAPFAPEGCVYGPWWGDAWECWWCIQLINGIERELAFEDGQWSLSDLDFDVTRELLRLAKENDAKTEFIKKTITLYGKPGGPWNIPSDPGGWLSEARSLVGEPSTSHEEAMKEIEE